MKRPKPLCKLSRLQRLILVALLDEQYARFKRREFRALIKLLHWGFGYPKPEATSVSLSRALGRLEERGYIIRRFPGCWRLTEFQLEVPDCGFVMALNAWSQEKERYAKLGLRGPTKESLGLSPEPAPQRTGVQVSLEKRPGPPFGSGSIRSVCRRPPNAPKNSNEEKYSLPSPTPTTHESLSQRASLSTAPL
jgi:hypothetical protein